MTPKRKAKKFLDKIIKDLDESTKHQNELLKGWQEIHKKLTGSYYGPRRT